MTNTQATLDLFLLTIARRRVGGLRWTSPVQRLTHAHPA